MLRDFIGNARLVGQLQHIVATEQARHAYLFTGADQIGKRTLALAFAQSIQCQQRTVAGDACGTCVACRKMLHGNHPDLLTLSLPKDKQHYSIDQIRELIEQVALKPTEGPRRIFLIPDAEMLTIQALQSSLKVLEEPPPQAMILLTCASTDLLLPTIISRCQEIALAPVAPAEMASGLVARFRQVTHDAALTMAQLSGGCPGWAIDALDTPDIVTERRQLLHGLVALSRATRAERSSAAGVYAADKDHAKHAIELWIPWWRDVLLAAQGAPSLIRHADDSTTIEALANRCGPAAAERFVRALLRALEELEQNANPRLVFEVMLQDLPSTS